MIFCERHKLFKRNLYRSKVCLCTTEIADIKRFFIVARDIKSAIVIYL